MEEKKAYGLVMVFVGVFVFLLVSIMGSVPAEGEMTP